MKIWEVLLKWRDSCVRERPYMNKPNHKKQHVFSPTWSCELQHGILIYNILFQLLNVASRHANLHKWYELHFILFPIFLFLAIHSYLFYYKGLTAIYQLHERIKQVPTTWKSKQRKASNLRNLLAGDINKKKACVRLKPWRITRQVLLVHLLKPALCGSLRSWNKRKYIV